jgi:SOS-response transcriptional repressor LexA
MSSPKDPLAPTGLTEKQRACLDAIEAHLACARTMPSIEELRVSLGMASKSGVVRLLRQLEERGRIARLPLRSRAIRLLASHACPRCGATMTEETEAA